MVKEIRRRETSGKNVMARDDQNKIPESKRLVGRLAAAAGGAVTADMPKTDGTRTGKSPNRQKVNRLPIYFF